MDVDAGANRWLARRGVRWRSTVAAVIVVGLALIAGAAALLLVLHHSLVSGVNDTASQRAADISAQISAGDIAAARPTIDASTGDGTLVQVISGPDTVVMSSPSLDGEPPISAARPAPGKTVVQDVDVEAADSESYRVVSVGVNSATGPVVVVTAQSLSDVSTTLRTVATLLALGSPFLLAMVAIATWMAVGRSLSAVDTIRRRVETIESTDLHLRVPVPAADDAVGQLAATMNAMLARLERSSEVQRQFVADASHELRSPLASVRASLDVAEREGDSAAWARSTDVISDEVERMTVLVARLLTLAKADEGALTMQRIDVDLDDLVLSEARRLQSQTGLEIRTDVPPTRILGDPDRLAEALRNLTDNASRFARSVVELRIVANGDGQMVSLSVSDDGAGVPADDRDRVSERFVRLDDHRGRTDGGAGLGLAIVTEIARAHGGKLTVGQSSLGGGQFTISLPQTAHTTQSPAIR